MNLATKIEELHRLAHRHWMKNGAALGLSYSEFEYLSAIKEQEILLAQNGIHGQHLHDIVRTMGVNKASASAMMDKLEKRKLVRVKPCKRDARAKHFLLSKKGEQLRLAGQEAYDSLVALETENLQALLSIPPATAKNETASDEPVAAATPPKKQKSTKPQTKQPESQPAELPQLNLFG